MKLPLDRRPLVIAVAGPNGAGKTTFYHAHLKPAALRLLNADIVAKELGVDPYMAAACVGSIRDELIKQRESFVIETVFSDPVGDKLSFLSNTVSAGYNVVLCFIGIADALTSEERVAMRVSQGGHDVPTDKLKARFPRTLDNLKKALSILPSVWVFDNSDLRKPFRRIAVFEDGKLIKSAKPLPKWFKNLL